MKFMKITIAMAGGIALAASAMSSTATAGVTDADISNDSKTTHQIVTNGMGRKGQRFSPLKTVNKFLAATIF